MSVPDEYSTVCDICDCYNVKVICPSCMKKILEGIKDEKINIDAVLKLLDNVYFNKKNFEKLIALVEKS